MSLNNNIIIMNINVNTDIKYIKKILIIILIIKTIILKEKVSKGTNNRRSVLE